jgi:hypothetical protein
LPLFFLLTKLTKLLEDKSSLKEEKKKKKIFLQTKSISFKLVNPPLGNWAKLLNIDGSCLGNSGCAGGEGLLRDSIGVWLAGFSPT